MLNIFIAALGMYLLFGVMILVIIRLLARRWRTLSWPNLFISSISAALIALVALYCFVEIAGDSNVGGGSGVGAVILMVVGLIIGGIVGLFVLCLVAGLLSKKVMLDPRLSSKSVSANSLTLLLACTMIPALLILFDLFFDAEGFFVVAFCGICLGIAGLRESLLLDSKLDNLVITKRLLWVGLLSAVIALLGIVARYIMSESIMHSKSFITFAIVSIALAIPIGLFIWRIRKSRLHSQNSASTETQTP